MKVLMFGMSSYPGGIENYIVNYFCHPIFPADRIQIDFITYEPAIAYEEKLIEKGYHVYRVPHLKRSPVRYYKEVKELFQRNKYDAVYVNMLTAANALPVFLAEHFRIKQIILHAHASLTISGALRRTLHRVNKKHCNRVATLRFACSEKAGEWLFGNDAFTVIPNAIDCYRFKPSEEYREEVRRKYSVSDSTLLIGHIGRFATEKNHEFMVDILQEVINQRVDAKLMFVGDGYTREAVEQKVKAAGLEKRVIFIGTTSETEKYYPAFDVFLFPSTFEGFGMAALEAQSCGVPCICSDTLSPLLNVTGKNVSLSLDAGSERWGREITTHRDTDPHQMNQLVRESEFNIERQILKLSGLLEDRK